MAVHEEPTPISDRAVTLHTLTHKTRAMFPSHAMRLAELTANRCNRFLTYIGLRRLIGFSDRVRTDLMSINNGGEMTSFGIEENRPLTVAFLHRTEQIRHGHCFCGA